jgi:hypothetical protein
LLRRLRRQLAATGHASTRAAGDAGYPRAAWEHRNGAGVTMLRDAHSTADKPIEMCGVPAATEWLTTLRCNDGSQPLKDSRQAELARTGNLGEAGRCRAIAKWFPDVHEFLDHKGM